MKLRVFLRVSAPTIYGLVSCLLIACVSDRDWPKGEIDREKVARDNMALGLAYLQRGQFARAKSKLVKAEINAPDLAELHDVLGYFYSQTNEYKLSRQHYRRALQQQPDNPNFQNNYGTFLCRLGEFDKAEKYFLRAATNEAYVTPDKALENAGVCALKDKREHQAMVFLRDALKRNPSNQKALLVLSELYYNQHQYQLADSRLQRYFNVTKPGSRSLWLGVLIARAFGRQQQALAYERRLQQEFPDSKETALLIKPRQQDG